MSWRGNWKSSRARSSTSCTSSVSLKKLPTPAPLTKTKPTSCAVITEANRPPRIATARALLSKRKPRPLLAPGVRLPFRLLPLPNLPPRRPKSSPAKLRLPKNRPLPRLLPPPKRPKTKISRALFRCARPCSVAVHRFILRLARPVLRCPPRLVPLRQSRRLPPDGPFPRRRARSPLRRRSQDKSYPVRARRCLPFSRRPRPRQLRPFPRRLRRRPLQSPRPVFRARLQRFAPAFPSLLRHVLPAFPASLVLPHSRAVPRPSRSVLLPDSRSRAPLSLRAPISPPN